MLAALLLAILSQAEADASDFVRAHRAADQSLSAGRFDEARAGFERCLELRPQHAATAYGIACAHAKSGEQALALEWLARAADWGHAEAELALWDEDLATLRASNGFRTAIEALRKNLKGPAHRALVGTLDTRASSRPVDVGIDRAGTRIVAGFDDGSLLLLDARTGDQLARTSIAGTSVWDLDLQPDGKRAAVLTKDGLLRFWNTVDASELQVVGELLDPVASPEWAYGALLWFDPTGHRLLAAGRNEGASLWTAGGELIRRFDTGAVRTPGTERAWNADGSRIAHWSGSTVRFFDGRTGVELEGTIVSAADVECVAFDKAGKWIATGHVDSRVRLWDARTLQLRSESHAIRDVFHSDFRISELRFSPNDEWLAFSTNIGVLVGVVDVATCKELPGSEYLGGRMGEEAPLMWSSDSRRLWASFAGGGYMREFELGTGMHSMSLAWSRVPQASDIDLAAFTAKHGISSLDMASGRVLWTLVALGREGRMFQTAEGYFDCSFDDLAELLLFGKDDDEAKVPLSSRAVELFDPKRVRAAKQGVTLAPLAN